jgi:cob(I)alamin adenosyltransferase
MKIYTKKGDKGYTSLIGGVRVSKNSLRINSYGTLDELNASIGLVRDVIKDSHTNQILYKIQNQLFNIGSHLASHPEKSNMKLPDIDASEITLMETEMDAMNEVLPPLAHFILPGGHIHVSFCHLARCVCRRAERLVVDLNESEKVDAIIIQYLNRLSDYLFVLGRKIAMDENVEEVKWIPAK